MVVTVASGAKRKSKAPIGAVPPQLALALVWLVPSVGKQEQGAPREAVRLRGGKPIEFARMARSE